MNTPKIVDAEPIEITEEELPESRPFWKSTKFKILAAAGTVATVLMIVAAVASNKDEDEEDFEQTETEDFLPEIDASTD